MSELKNKAVCVLLCHGSGVMYLEETFSLSGVLSQTGNPRHRPPTDDRNLKISSFIIF